MEQQYSLLGNQEDFAGNSGHIEKNKKKTPNSHSQIKYCHFVIQAFYLPGTGPCQKPNPGQS